MCMYCIVLFGHMTTRLNNYYYYYYSIEPSMQFLGKLGVLPRRGYSVTQDQMFASIVLWSRCMPDK